MARDGAYDGEVTTAMLLIDGEWLETDDRIAVRNPFNNEIVGYASRATREQTLAAARHAKAYESNLTAFDRYEILANTAAQIERDEAEFVAQIVAECGACVQEAQKEVRRAVTLLRVCAEEARRISGEAIPTDVTADRKRNLAVTLRVPVGLVCAITPFNRPLNQVVVKLAPAIAANNSVILKPSEKTPLSAVKFVRCLIANGLPARMVSVVTGDPREVGETLVTCPDVDMITFTGSRAVGERIARSAGMIRTAFELGDSGALVVLDDADLALAADVAAKGAFATAGQSCRGVKRLLVQEGVADRFAELLVDQAKKIRFGDPFSTQNDIGCLIDEPAARAVEQRVSESVESGAKLLYGPPREGVVLGPQVLDFVPKDSALVREETFGPCAPIVRVKDLDEAVECINGGDYGLQTGVFTADIRLAFEAARRIRSGAVIINDGPQFESPFIPFGGVKKSGLGREGARFAIEEMTTVKTIVF
ncbi:aldehyde dehydrogenase family protein [Plantactinospora endophytica]|uniref:Aldehyde dehydrogenase n=1 Tax=Plantactinospora endophytica TaxID=673535 RepID=A0ABQ4E132_9ACTN|nr:aldehyde dehydrogenase family protein [Plantactinospora endophytica]GIG88052.1 aldehyde dehydrogenase [Plantactinospora endophytica]